MEEKQHASEGNSIGRLTRRDLLATAPALTAFVLSSNQVKADSANKPPPPDPTKVPGAPISAFGGYGTPSAFETASRSIFDTGNQLSAWATTPLGASVGVITPSGLHFERHHAGVPTIDPTTHELFVHGLVGRPKKYSIADLKRFPSVTRTHFIECAGNGFTEWQAPTEKTVQGTHGLFSTSEWTGVAFSTIAREIGVRPGAAWVLAEGADAARMARSIPLAKLLADGIIAYGQNGEAVRPEQGYPLRLIVPGFEGSTHIKWLSRLEIADKPMMTREETAKYTNLYVDGMARQFAFVMEAKSVITSPSGGMQLPGRGFYEISGLAWSGRGRIRRAEISTDDGKRWSTAALQTPLLPMCGTRFRFSWYWDGAPAVLQSRCTDDAGHVQPTLKDLVATRGHNGLAGSPYHFNAIQSWAVARDGGITNAHA